jgi:hypothetical protein
MAWMEDGVTWRMERGKTDHDVGVNDLSDSLKDDVAIGGLSLTAHSVTSVISQRRDKPIGPVQHFVLMHSQSKLQQRGSRFNHLVFSLIISIHIQYPVGCSLKIV